MSIFPDQPLPIRPHAILMSCARIFLDDQFARSTGKPGRNNTGCLARDDAQEQCTFRLTDICQPAYKAWKKHGASNHAGASPNENKARFHQLDPADICVVAGANTQSLRSCLAKVINPIDKRNNPIHTKVSTDTFVC